MSRNDTIVSSQAWHDLCQAYQQAGGESATDIELANLLREHMFAVEGIA